MGTNAWLVAFTLLGLVGCGSFGEQPDTSDDLVAAPIASTPAAAQKSTQAKPTTDEPTPVAEPTTDALPPPAKATIWSGKAAKSAAVDIGGTLACRHTMTFENIQVDVTVAPDGKVTTATVAATAVEKAEGATCSLYGVAPPNAHTYRAARIEVVDGQTRINLDGAATNSKKASAVITGRFDPPGSTIAVRWKANDGWSSDTEVSGAFAP